MTFQGADLLPAVAPRWRLPLLFLACALPLGLVLVQLVPLGEVPDETAHVVRAYALSTGQWIGRRVVPPGRTVPEAGYKVDTGLFSTAFASRAEGEIVSAALEQERAGTAWSGRTMFVSAPNTASYAPGFYVLSAAALALGRLAGAGPELCILLARAANLLGFAALGTAALLLARRARYALFVLLCLPSGLSLAASVNQDGLFIGVLILAVSLLTRPEPAARRWAALALAAACMAKPPYLPLLLVLVLPARGEKPVPGRKRGQVRNWAWAGAGAGLGLAVLAALPGVLWSILALHRTVVPFWAGEYVPGPLYTGGATTLSYTDGAAQLAILRAHPGAAVRIAADTVTLWWHIWLTEVVGVLGRLNLRLPDPLYHAWYAALACAVIGDVLAWRPLPGAAWTPARAVTTVAGVGAASLLVLLVQYMTWTHVGETTVLGMQGRYLVPLLAASLLALPAFPVLRGWAASAWLVPALGANVAQLAVLPALVVRRWYLH